MNVPSLADYEHVITLSIDGYDRTGICPRCGKPTLRLQEVGGGIWEPSCPQCTPASIRDTVRALVLRDRSTPNGRQAKKPETEQPAVLFPLMGFKDIIDMTTPAWQVEEFFLDQSLVQVFGETNHGKSLLLWDLACNIANGAETWFGRAIVRPGPVVWVNADGGRGIVARARAWAEAHEIEGDLKHPLLTLMGAVHLNQPREIGAFRSQLLAMDEKPVAVFFDTQSRCMTGARENDADEMTVVTDAMHRLKTEVGCSVVPIHHTDKTGQWERGSGVVKNESDTQIRVAKDLGSGIFTVSCLKGRDHPPFKDFHFTLTPCAESVVIVQHEGGPPKNRQEERVDRLDEALLLIAGQPGLSREELTELMQVSEATGRRYVATLADQGLILEVTLPKPEGSRGGPRKKGLFPCG